MLHCVNASVYCSKKYNQNGRDYIEQNEKFSCITFFYCDLKRVVIQLNYYNHPLNKSKI